MTLATMGLCSTGLRAGLRAASPAPAAVAVGVIPVTVWRWDLAGPRLRQRPGHNRDTAPLHVHDLLLPGWVDLLHPDSQATEDHAGLCRVSCRDQRPDQHVHTPVGILRESA